MKKTLSIFCLLISLSSYAQNYQCLQSGIKRYFTNGAGYLRGMRIDSVASTSGETIFYPYHTPRGHYMAAPNILDSTAGSWLGKKVVQLADGTTLFDNLWQDTVVIKTQANVGDTWVFYSDTSSLYYTAALVGKDTMTILGVVDSVKRILIRAHNGAGIVTIDPVDSFEILLSKNHGFAQVFDLYTFPCHAPGAAYNWRDDYYLQQIWNSSLPMKSKSTFSLIGLVNPTYQQLYQWNMGDKYEYAECEGDFGHPYFMCLPVEKYVLDSVTSSSTSAGSTIYTCGGWTASYYSGFVITGKSTTLTCSTVTLIDTLLMPEEFGQHMSYYYLPGDTSYCITNTLYKLQPTDIFGSRYVDHFESTEGYKTYKAPLGLLHSESGYGDVGIMIFSQTLIHYDRGIETCRSFVAPPTGVENINTNPDEISLLPNPATSQLTIKVATAVAHLSVYNITGQLLFDNVYNKKEITIDVNSLPAGLYFIRINDVVTKKFMKE